MPLATIEAESAVFSDMFHLSAGAQASDIEQGVPEWVVIELQQISKEAFRDLLSIIYPP